MTLEDVKRTIECIERLEEEGEYELAATLAKSLTDKYLDHISTSMWEFELGTIATMIRKAG